MKTNFLEKSDVLMHISSNTLWVILTDPFPHAHKPCKYTLVLTSKGRVVMYNAQKEYWVYWIVLPKE